ncbi:unnamed protein product [Haemonchus placei]|uniref:Uncharacterized protein n=1 Tax=Haemonchus placei TaxID=6290 RepID=A0A0N4WYX1_HAEPC|nr:unnamed protein product [Haemonchus placei]
MPKSSLGQMHQFIQEYLELLQSFSEALAISARIRGPFYGQMRFFSGDCGNNSTLGEEAWRTAIASAKGESLEPVSRALCGFVTLTMRPQVKHA